MPYIQVAIVRTAHKEIAVRGKVECPDLVLVFGDGVEAVFAILSVDIVHLDDVTVLRTRLRVCHGHTAQMAKLLVSTL
jgi:threonine dehydrogenase-like Zn-dependent dehydrogenase